MSFFGKPSDSTVGSFLPEDYLQKKAERRGVFIALFLFAVVALCVVGAFFVTNRQWQNVKAKQEEINQGYATETKKIEQLKQLEAQKADMLAKAEITTALIEKVPRSILLAELINRMPSEMTLTHLDLKSKRIIEAAAPTVKNPLTGQNVSLVSKNTQKAAEPPPKPIPPKFEFKVEITGLAATDDQIADYQSQLTRCPLLTQVEMLSSTEAIVEDVPMRKFRIDATIKPTADARNIEPLMIKRGAMHAGGTTASGDPKAAGGSDGLPGSGKKAPPLHVHAPRNPMDPTVPLDETPGPRTDAQGKPE